MNGRNARRERYEDLFFQVLLDEMLADEESEGNVLPFPEKDPEQERREEGLLQVCERTIQQERKRQRRESIFHRLVRRGGQLVAVLGLFIGVAGVAFASSESLRENLGNYLIQVMPEGTQFITIGGREPDKDQIPVTPMALEFGWLPDGLEQTLELADSKNYDSRYENEAGTVIDVTALECNGTVIATDTENCILQIVDINGLPGRLYQKEDGSLLNLIWFEKDETIFMQICAEHLEETDILKIARNIKLK